MALRLYFLLILFKKSLLVFAQRVRTLFLYVITALSTQVQSEHSSQQEGPRWSSLTLTGQYLALGLLLVLSLKTVHRNTEWLNTQTLAEAGLKDNPQNAKIHLTMANALAQKVKLSLSNGRF